jgi:predicted signal transduction protein with EAL and GGDEF domain
MYRAKWDGKNRYVVFESGMQDAVQSRMELEMDLREASRTTSSSSSTSPRSTCSDMSPTGVEALIRWKHPVRGASSNRRLHPAARGDRPDH